MYEDLDSLVGLSIDRHIHARRHLAIFIDVHENISIEKKALEALLLASNDAVHERRMLPLSEVIRDDIVHKVPLHPQLDLTS